MDNRIFFLLMAGCLAMGCFALPAAGAADPAPGFAENAEEITRALTAPPCRTRSFKLGPAKAPTRAIRVMAREGGQTVCKDVLVPEGQAETSGVNLKIEFDVNAHAIRPGSYGLLAELARALQGEALKERTVVIRGHTDSDGEDGYNLALSLRRAEAVREYLTAAFGIAGHRLRVEGWGEAHPLAPNDSAARKQRNRRVEIVCGP